MLQAFRNAANAVQRSDNWLGDYFRRMKAKGGNKYAMVATANKIATIYYKMVRYKQELTKTDDAFGKYMKYGMSLLTNLKGYYEGAGLEGKQKFLGSIFPEN